MHVPDGILPASVCAGGYAATGMVTWAAIGRINSRQDPDRGIPRASVMAAVFFVASWIHIPVPPVSTHLVLNGLLGVVLGVYAFPAILTGLFFQAVMFQHGGLTTLGVNAFIMGVPALAAGGLFRAISARFHSSTAHSIAGFLCGASALALSVLMLSALLILFFPGNLESSTGRKALDVLFLSHLPLMAIEGAIAASIVGFLMRVRPDVLKAAR